MLKSSGAWIAATTYHLELGSNGDVSHGAVDTPDPVTVAHCPFPPGPDGQFHQFSIALTVAVLMLSTPTPAEKLLKWTFSSPVGALNPTAISSLRKVFSEIAVPVIVPLA